MQVMYQQQFRPMSQITWVQGIEGAKAYQIMPNSAALFLDSENDGIMYIKTSDNIGMSSIRRFKYTELLEEPEATKGINASEYVRKDELEALIREVITRNEPTIQPDATKPAKTKS